MSYLYHLSNNDKIDFITCYSQNQSSLFVTVYEKKDEKKKPRQSEHKLFTMKRGGQDSLVFSRLRRHIGCRRTPHGKWICCIYAEDSVQRGQSFRYVYGLYICTLLRILSQAPAGYMYMSACMSMFACMPVAL